MINKPKISAIVSYYKGSRFLPGFLENYKKQTISEFIELVFVPCLLSEEDRLILQKFQAENPKLNLAIKEQTSLVSQAVCWNIGIKESKSDIVSIWNIDDLRTKYSFEEVVKCYENNNNLVGVSGNFIISNKFEDFTGKLIDHTIYSKKEYTRSMILGPFFSFKKEVCSKVGYFDEQLSVCSDFDFAIKLATCGEIFQTPRILGYFLDEQKGLSTNGDGKQPVERTVIEIRYGILDKIDNRFLKRAKEYKIEETKQFGEYISIKQLVPNIEELRKENCRP
jgi:hypothetical protein